MQVLPEVLSPFIGEVAALTAAGLWALASVIYGWLGQQISALALNVLKGCAAIAMLLLTIALTETNFSLNAGIPLAAILPLSLSGVVGIGIGDTAFFKVLNTLGPRRALLLETLAPPLTALLGLFFLQEYLSLQAWLGILITIAGVAWVLSERTASLSYAFNPDLLKQGLAWAFVAEICQATGILLSRSVFLEMEISPLWSSLVRISAGTFTALLLFGFQRRGVKLDPLQTVQQIQKRFTPRLLVGILLGAFGGTFLGIWLQQTAVKYTLAGIAQTLSATSPLFAIPIAVVCGEAVSLRSILGAIVSIIGIGVLFSAASGMF
ncbi:MAG: hypothetical protein RLZZ435_106 [Cyanobacteriota bacterium]